MKKRFALFSILLLLCTTSAIYAESDSKQNYINSLTDASSGMPSLSANTKLLDIPLVGGLTQFATMLDNFTSLVTKLCVLFAFLMIVFNSFKLMSGTIEVKKSFVDMVYKCVMCILIFAIYKPATNSLMKLSNSIGATCSGGYQKIDHVYTEAYNSLKQQIDKGLKEIQDTYFKNAFESVDGKKYITDNTIENLQKFGMTKQEAVDWAKQNGLNIAHEEFTTDWTGHDAQTQITKSTGWYDEDGKEIKGNNKFLFWSYTGSAKLTKHDKKINKQVNDKEQIQMVAKLNGLLEVLDVVDISEVAEEELALQKATAENNIQKVFYSPWLKTKDNVNTFFISPNAILKTCMVMSDALAYGVGTTINGVGELEDKKIIPTWKSILNFIQTLFYKLGMVIACVIIMAEYTITILEFYMIRALASFLIPLLFLDSTKSYAQNLLRLFLTYFMKILVTTLCCFFALGMYMDVLSLSYNTLDVTTSISIVTYLSTMVIGLLIAQKAPQIAMTVMNGNPSMGFGDVVRMAGSMAHAAHSMERMAHKGEEFFKKAAKGGQDFARGAADTFQTLDTAFVAGRTTGEKLDEAKSSGQWSGKESDKRAAQRAAFWGTLGSAAKQAVGDKAHKAVFGTDRHHLDERSENTEGFWKVGQQVMIGGRQRTATAEDVKKHNAELAENKAENAFNNSLPSHPRAPDKTRDPDEEERKRRIAAQYPEPGH